MLCYSKLTVVFLCGSLTLLAQPPQPGRQPVPQLDVSKVPVQPAQTVTVALSSELATALEKFRRTIMNSSTDEATGVTTTAPVYPTIADLVMGAMSSPGGLFRRVLKQFPPDNVKAAQEAATQAAKDAAAAEDKALKTK